jgi:hypothetical protein
MTAIAIKGEVKNPVDPRGDAFTAARPAFSNEIKCCRALRDTPPIVPGGLIVIHFAH